MEPNQNVPGVGSTRPVAGPAPRPATQRAVQPTAQPAPAEAGPVFKDEPKKKSHATLLGMILLSILAIGGIGFGVWAYLDGNARVAKLNEKITELNGTIAEMQTVNEEEATVDENGVATTTETGDYIYVGEWGIKIKKPSNWKEIVRTYNFYNGYPQAADSLEIRETDKPGDGVAISVGGESCDSQVGASSGTCFMVDEKVIIVTELIGELAGPDSSVISEEFINHFTNSENYSAI